MHLLVCPACKMKLTFEAGRRSCCTIPGASALEDGLLVYDPTLEARAPPEMRQRDNAAEGYMQHRKFPTQKDRLRRFIADMRTGKEQAVLDLGCGPGPTTGLLIDAGYHVTAVDFSRRSLRINATSLTKDAEHAVFVQADMRDILFREECADGLMMADFLQHLGDADVQRRFLHKAFAALKPGGWFYLTFFNTNIVNRMKGDVVGSFSNGQIPYRRLSAREVRAMLPGNARVTATAFSNIFHDVWPDRIATALPGAGLLARMVILSGRKA